MPYLASFMIMADGADISGHVLRARFGYGMNVANNENGYNRARSRGAILLNNSGGYWTDTRLAALTDITFMTGTITLVECRVSTYKYAPDRRHVTVLLAGAEFEQYERQIMFQVEADTDEPTLLTATGVALTPESDWLGMEADTGSQFSGPLQRFIDAFSNFADGYVYEAHDGEFRILVPHTDARAVSGMITPSDYYIDERGASTHLRPRWRRDAQDIFSIPQALAGDGFREEGSVDDLPVISVTRVGGNTRVWHVTFRPEASLDAGQRDRFRFYTNVSEITLRIDLTQHGGGMYTATDTVYITAADTGQLEFTVNLSDFNAPDGELPSSESNRRNLVLFADISGAFTVTMNLLADSPDVSEQTLMAGTEIDHGLLTRMPWAIAETSVPLAQARIERRAATVPRVTILSFPAYQPSQTQWETLAGTRIGANLGVDINTSIMDVSNESYPLFMDWNIIAGGVSTLNMHLVEHTVVSRTHRQVRYNQMDVRLERDAATEDDDLDVTYN